VSVLTIVAVVGIVVYVIARQLIGEPLRGKRLLILPAVLAIVGIADMAGNHGRHPTATDIVLIVVGTAIAAIVGVKQGLSMRLEARRGHLWGQMPVRGLWLWVALVATRGMLDGLGYAVGAHVATGSAAILLALGVNRLAQAVVVVPRALAAGIPFAPEKNGTTLRSGVLGAGRQRPSDSPAAGPSLRGKSLPESWLAQLIGHASSGRSPSYPAGANRSADNLSRQDWRMLLRQIVDRLDDSPR
jgi:hypothetical protein